MAPRKNDTERCDGGAARGRPSGDAAEPGTSTPDGGTQPVRGNPLGRGRGGGGEADPRVAAVRRVGAIARRRNTLHLAGCAALLAVARTAGSIAIGAARDNGSAIVVDVVPGASALWPSVREPDESTTR